jgi:hypothetical protein
VRGSFQVCQKTDRLNLLTTHSELFSVPDAGLIWGNYCLWDFSNLSRYVGKGRTPQWQRY